MSYSNFGNAEQEKIITELIVAGKIPETGIESDKKRRGTAINVDIVKETEALFLLQVRTTHFHPRRYNDVSKEYFLCGRRADNNEAFAVAVDARSTTPIALAIKRVELPDFKRGI